MSAFIDQRRNRTSRLGWRSKGLVVGLSSAMVAFALGTTIGFAQSDSPSEPEEIERAKRVFTRSRDDWTARSRAAKVLYPLIKQGTPRSQVLNLLGAPDRFPKLERYSRFLNYAIGEGQWIEIEFDRQRELVVHKSETGLGIDPPRGPMPRIPEELREYLADYPVETKEGSDRIVLRAGFIPVKPRIVWGEPMTLTMSVGNVGIADFEFMFGGDSRGTGRHDRIKINVTDTDGNELPDPHANAPNFGGMGRYEIITPGGQNFTYAIDLSRFRTIAGPGRYKVTCSFAFDEPHTNIDGPRKPVIKSTFPFTILGREPERVASVLDELQTEVAETPDDRLPEVMASIARFGQDDAVPRLDEYARTGTTAQRTAALAALPLAPGEAALDVALARLSDADPAIRVAACSALGRMPQELSIDALLDALDREQSPVKEAGIVALGVSKSKRGLPVLSRTLDEGSTELRSAAVSALVHFGGSGAVTALRRHVDSSDLAFRYQVVHALVTDLRSPLDPDWLLPILMCRRHNSREWLDSLSLVRVWGGDRAFPVLLSCLDFEVPWSHRNFWILHNAEYAKGAPKFKYVYDPNSKGTPEEYENNRKTLKILRGLAGPIPESNAWPLQPVPLLETDPPIDFTPTLSTLKGEGETQATVRCGFFQESWDRNGGSVTFSPSEAHRPTYQAAKDVRAILKSPDRAKESGLTEQQLQELRKLDIPPKSPVIKEGLTLLYIWWQESPDGPICQRAKARLCDRVRAAVQEHHTDHTAFAAAARKIIDGVQQRAEPE